MKTTIRLAITACMGLLMATIPALAQHDLTMYHMQQVPQRIFQNPAFIPEQKFYIGIPALSGIQSSFANPFAYNDAIERDSDDSVTLKVDSFIGKIETNDMLRLYSDVEIISLGTRLAGGRFFLGFSIRERACQHAAVPADLLNLAWYGNASPKVFGREVNIAPSLNLAAFDEYGVSFSGYAMKRKISWGARLKFLAGRINATTTRSEFAVVTDTATYQLNMRSDLEYRTSGIDDIDNYFDQPISALVFPENRGFGFDAGAEWQVTDRIRVSASVLDVGYIKWKYNTLDLVTHNPGETFVFSGVTLEGFLEMLDSLDNFGKKLTDSIFDLVEIDSVYDRTYTSWLPSRFNLGGSYALDRHHFNLLLNGILWNHRFHPALSVSYEYRLPRILGVMVSYNLFNRQYTNFGGGLSVSAGPIQFYAVTDNIPGLIWYRSSNNYSIRFGINIAIRLPKQGAPPDPAPAEAVPEGTP